MIASFARVEQRRFGLFILGIGDIRLLRNIKVFAATKVEKMGGFVVPTCIDENNFRKTVITYILSIALWK
jgi:hypothetical protein